MKRLGLSIAVFACLIVVLACGTVFAPVPNWAVAWFVKENPAYFLDPPAGSIMSSPLRRIVFAAIDLKLQYALKSRLMADAVPGTEIKAINFAVARAQDLIITQRELPQPSYDTSTVTASLVRGYGYCDYINGVVALILTGRLEDVELFGTDPLGVETASHSLVRAKTSMGTIFVDAWADESLWGFTDDLSDEGRSKVRSFANVVDGLQVSLPKVREANFRAGRGFNRFDLEYRFQKGYDRLIGIITGSSKPRAGSPSATSLVGQSNDQKVDTPVPGSHNERLKLQYLEARIQHILGNPETALEFYQKVAAAPCETVYCNAARIFSSRLSRAKISRRSVG